MKNNALRLFTTAILFFVRNFKVVLCVRLCWIRGVSYTLVFISTRKRFEISNETKIMKMCDCKASLRGNFSLLGGGFLRHHIG